MRINALLENELRAKDLEIAEWKAEIARLREALKYYADKGGTIGKRARSALTEVRIDG